MLTSQGKGIDGSNLVDSSQRQSRKQFNRINLNKTQSQSPQKVIRENALNIGGLIQEGLGIPEEKEAEQKAFSENTAEPYILEDADNQQQIKKPPQVPSLKIQQAQPSGPQGNPLSEGVSAVSTMGGVTGNMNAGDYSSNP